MGIFIEHENSRVLGPSLRSEKGQAALVFALAFALLSGVLTLQMAATHNYVNALHSDQKTHTSQRDILQRLGMQVKLAFDQGRMDSSCPGLKRKDIDGETFCLPADGTICVSMPATSSTASARKACLSLEPASLALSPASTSSVVGTVSNPETENGLDLPVTRVNITVPAVSDTLWKSCAGKVCVNLVLCPLDKTSCTLSEAQASQVMMIENT